MVTKGITAQKGLTLIRYADDFVVLHKDIAVVQRCQQIIAKWLKGIGLELKPSKTRLTHTLNRNGEESAGFDFLGFTVRQFPVGKYQSGKNSNGNPLGFKTLIKPSQKKVKLHTEKLNVIVRNHKGATQEALISHINPIIRGWTNFYSTVVSKETFSEVDNIIFYQLMAWARFRHPNKNAHWRTRRYWLVNQGEGWVFASRKEGINKMHLRMHSETPIVRHIKVQGERSPYDGDFVYWGTRMGKHPETDKKTATLLKRQKGKCSHCEMFFRDGDLLEIDHINPKAKGGKNSYDNLQLLHRHCHDTKTAVDFKTAVRHQELDEKKSVLTA